MIVRDEVRAAVEGIATAGVEWRRAYNDVDQAVKAQNLLTERMARRVLRATDGVSVTRWEQQCRRRSIRNIEDAKSKARAIRARRAVEAAVAEGDQVLAEGDARVRAARAVLAEASVRMARFGLLGQEMIGQSGDELRRLARDR